MGSVCLSGGWHAVYDVNYHVTLWVSDWVDPGGEPKTGTEFRSHHSRTKIRKNKSLQNKISEDHECKKRNFV